ncbi:MAG: hypothetical protein SGARI_008132, partial [Bacillariaceae sp.]
MVVLSRDEIREDAEQSVATPPSVSSHRNLYKQHPQQQHAKQRQQQYSHHQPAFDEWEAAIVTSMSERPDEIIDILERYAEEREQLSMREGDERYGEDEEEEEFTIDESREDTEGSTPRDVASTRSGWSSARESFVAGFVEELRAKVARLTYESSVLVSKPVNSGTPVQIVALDNPETEAKAAQLQADLDAEVLKSQSLAQHLEESRAMHEAQMQEMYERIQWLESEAAHTNGQDTVTEEA